MLLDDRAFYGASFNVNEMDSQGNTALYYAINSRNVELVKRLLAVPEIDPNLRGPTSPPPIFRADYTKQQEMVDLLLAHGADPLVIWSPPRAYVHTLSEQTATVGLRFA
jgi:ankyrin repeat protein